ncbi:blue light receptor [Pyricularia oryzae]|nr:blue light receptor [Pyricularia oryzae]KAI6296975.1 blue light receptor [Pyricularia grisea]KAH9437817.1 blue light receptor [Pyricularia oryzae]KAI6252213.1 blue light receptor [Pyricularia oryzae]KAI6278080.1 blue light receptor [Pyricularia oryzae]
MAHRHQQQPSGSLFGFVSPMDMQSSQPPVSQDNSAMSLVDPSMLSHFDTPMQMSLEGDSNVLMAAQQPFQRPIASNFPTSGSPSASISSMSQNAPGLAARPQARPGQISNPSLQNHHQAADSGFSLPSPDEHASPMSGALTVASKQNYGGMPPPPQPSLQQQSGAHGPPGSIVTEYTKRRDWAARTAEELADLQQILDQDGRIKYVSPSVTALTGYTKDEILDVLLQDLIHPDDVGVYLSEMHDAAATGGSLRIYYRLKKKDGTYGVFESTGHAHIATARFSTNPNNQSHFRQAVFLMSRPYPTKNAELLDSFLEHKIENERLRRRIAELRKEEYEDGGEDAQRNWPDGRSEMTSEDATVSVSTGTTPRHAQQQVRHSSFGDVKGVGGVLPTDGKLGNAVSGILNSALTRENLEDSTARNRQDSIKDKMMRYEGHSHAETIEMLTGLRYKEGERTHGFTSHDSNPTLTKGDAGIAIPIDRDPRVGADKKKKVKVAEEYVCTDCGTLDSPEWRKGPSGPKTLCNACGLRWAKKEKKRNPKTGSGSGSTPAAVRLVEQ